MPSKVIDTSDKLNQRSGPVLCSPVSLCVHQRLALGAEVELKLGGDVVMAHQLREVHGDRGVHCNRGVTAWDIDDDVTLTSGVHDGVVGRGRGAADHLRLDAGPALGRAAEDAQRVQQGVRGPWSGALAWVAGHRVKVEWRHRLGGMPRRILKWL